MTMTSSEHDSNPTAPLIRRHLFVGWSALFVFAVLGLFLEGLHAFKTPWYLDTDNETRRLLWRLGHAHGGLLAILHLAFSFSLSVLPGFRSSTAARTTSFLFTLALFSLPAGFLLGGAQSSDGDPGIFILLVPIGAVSLLAALLLSARATFKA